MAVNDTWIRNRARTPFTLFVQDIDVASIPISDTILRIHGAVEVILVMPAHTSYGTIEPIEIIAGLYTTLTSGGTLLAPASQQADFAPPLQRWLWWESLLPVSEPIRDQGSPDTRQVYRWPTAQTPLDIRSKVKATTAIDLHLAVQTSTQPANARSFDIRWWFSVLRSGT